MLHAASMWSCYANNQLCVQQGDALRVYKTEASRKANEVHGLIRSGSAAFPDVCTIAWNVILLERQVFVTESKQE